MLLLLDVTQVGWTEALLRDLSWITVAEHFSGCGSFALDDWVKHIRASPGQFKELVNQFARTKFANLHEGAEAIQKEPTPQSDNSFDCSICSTSFPTFQQYSLHMFKRHQCKNIWRLYVGTSTACAICLRQFWSRERLLNHIRYRSQLCKCNYRLRAPVISETEAVVIDSQLASDHARLARNGRRRHFADEPVIRLAGPLLPIVTDPDGHTSSHHPLGFGHNYYS